MTETVSAALVDELAAQIREKIMSGEYPVGTPLRQAELATTFGTSRTPIREALRQLQSGGLIELQPNRGAVVRVPVPWEIREVYEIRADLEALAARRAASRLDDSSLARLREANDAMYRRSTALATGAPVDPSDANANDRFHSDIAAASGNSRLERMLTEINDAFPRNVSGRLLLENSRHREENFAEHAQILDAIESGDATHAADLMRTHVLHAGEHLAQWYERRSSTVFTG